MYDSKSPFYCLTRSIIKERNHINAYKFKMWLNTPAEEITDQVGERKKEFNDQTSIKY